MKAINRNKQQQKKNTTKRPDIASSSDDKEAPNIAPLQSGALVIEGTLRWQIKSHNGIVICFKTITVP